MRLSLAMACLSLFAFSLASPGTAQAQRPSNSNNNNENPSARGNANSEGMELEAVPEGWIRIATDTNGDGRYDRVEMIHVYDLEQARQNSSQRTRGGSSNQGQGQGQEQAIQVDGTIRSVRSVELQGMTSEHKSHQLVKIRTDDGQTIRADLGPKAGLSELNLKEGQSISVRGTVGSINDRPVLMADRVSSGGKTEQVRLPEGLGHRRIHAQVLGTRTARFKRQDGEHVIAHLRLLNGQQVDALLGPKDKLSSLNLHEGDAIDLLAHPGRLNSDPVLVAEQVHSGDQVVSIDRPSGRQGRRFGTQDNQESEK